jgi:hypothetical protein
MVRRIGAILLTLAVALTGLLVVASPASAALRCQDNIRKFSTPALDPTINVKLCIATEENVLGQLEVQARAYVSWSRAPLLPIGTAFEKFEFNLRLEYNDAVIDKYPCYPVGMINSQRNGSWPYETDWRLHTNGPFWTADATVRFNINNDGRGDQLWELTGSPAI